MNPKVFRVELYDDGGVCFDGIDGDPAPSTLELCIIFRETGREISEQADGLSPEEFLAAVRKLVNR